MESTRPFKVWRGRGGKRGGRLLGDKRESVFIGISSLAFSDIVLAIICYGPLIYGMGGPYCNNTYSGGHFYKSRPPPSAVRSGQKSIWTKTQNGKKHIPGGLGY